MATRLKTISYAYDTILAPALNAQGSFGSIDISIPEASATGGVTFKSVIARFDFTEKGGVSTATNLSITQRSISLSLSGVATQSYTNTGTIINSGEDINACLIRDVTDHFTTNWGSMDGLPRALAASGLVNAGAGYTPGNFTLSLNITYLYNDEATTHVKTVYIPMVTPRGALATSVSTVDTISSLSAYLPENSYSIKNTVVIIQGNTQLTSTTDYTFTSVVSGSLTANTNSYDNFEAAGNTDYFYRLIHSFDATAVGWDTNPINIRLGAGAGAAFNHPQVYLQVTYEFNATATTRMLCSLILPLDIASPMGGTASTDYQRVTRSLWVQEENPVLTCLSYYLFYDTAAGIAGLNCRIYDSVSFSAYTDTVALDIAGSMALNIKYEGATNITRGLNNFNFDIYRTDPADFGFNLGGFFIINYQCDKPSEGVGAANHSVAYNAFSMSSTTASAAYHATFPGITIPESKYFINALGININYISNGTGNPAGSTLVLEQTDEGYVGNRWLPAYTEISTTDAEVGVRQCWAQVRDIFKRYPGDPDGSRLELSSSRAMRFFFANACTGYINIDFYFTYHSISYSLTSTVSNSNNATVTLDLHRKLNDMNEKVLQKTRTGNGTVVWDWYDNTTNMFIVARETDALVGRSGDFTF